MPVTTETAVVFRGAARRYFTKAAAIKSFAKAGIRKRCDCDDSDPSVGYPGDSCIYHRDDYGRRIIQRFARLYRRACVQKTGEPNA